MRRQLLRVFEMIVPLPQKACRYALAWYFTAFRQNTSV